MRMNKHRRARVGRAQLPEPDTEYEGPPPSFRELFAGPSDETGEERAVRLTAAREVLADLLDEGETDEFAMQDALYAVRLGGSALMRCNCLASQRSRGR